MDKQQQGKQSRSRGKRFELRVRKDLEKQGWIVDKWSNNVEFGYWDGCPREFIPRKWKDLTLKNGKHYPGPVARLIKAKAKWAGPGRPMMMGSGFPDFCCHQCGDHSKNLFWSENPAGNFNVIGVESKMTGKLDTEEKEKCRWLLRNKIFSKILIASSGEKRGTIIYKTFEIKKRAEKQSTSQENKQ